MDHHQNKTSGQRMTTSQRLRPGLVLAVLCLAQFMLVLDISVTNVALASVRAELGFAVGDLQWIVTAYVLVFGSLLIFFGRAGDLWGRRRLFLVGTALFSAASLLCGLAQAPWQLVAARALQGLGAAMVSPAALSLLTTSFEEGPPRNKALGVWGAIAAGGAAAGMIIGGTLTDVGSWRWVFLINVPIGMAVAIAALRVVPESRMPSPVPLDVPGALTVSGGLLALVYGLTRVGPEGSTASAAAAFLVALLLLGAFVVVERRAQQPIVDAALLRIRGVASANAFSVLSTAVVVGQSFFLSLYLREVLRFSPLRTGFALVPITLVVIAVASALPRVLPRVGVRAALVMAGALLAAGMALQARLPVDGSYVRDVLPAIVVTAAGLGLGFVSATIAATTGVEAQQQGLASGLLNTSQQIGGAVGLTVLATLAASRTTDLIGRGESPLNALNGGFSIGLIGAFVLGLLAAVAALAAPGRELPPPSVGAQEAAASAPPAPVVVPTPTHIKRSSS
jgi:EmrB/QacA subfamily drug resistance transporter